MACWAPCAAQQLNAAATSWLRPSIHASTQSPRGGSNIKVVVNGAASTVGKAAIRAITKARGMTIAGAVDSLHVGLDAGELAGLEDPIEVPVLDDLVMVLGSLSQSTTSGVFVEFSTDSATVYDNVRNATAFGMKSVVCSPDLDPEVVGRLVIFCEKASTGCIVCPTLSIGRILLQQAAISAAFHYGSVQIIETSQERLAAVPSTEATLLATNISGLGRVYNQGDGSEDGRAATGAVVGDGVRVHSLLMPGPGLSSMDVRLSGPGEALSLKHDIGNVSALMPGLLLAIRRVVKLKALVYGLEKIL